jgi:hypothetical protein
MCGNYNLKPKVVRNCPVVFYMTLNLYWNFNIDILPEIRSK